MVGLIESMNNFYAFLSKIFNPIFSNFADYRPTVYMRGTKNSRSKQT